MSVLSYLVLFLVSFRVVKPQPSGDMENNTVTSHISHVSVESARTGSWSGSAVGGFGFVDYPAGIPHKQWVRAVYVLLSLCGMLSHG